MRLKLTKSTVESLAPASRAYEVYDTEISGLMLRVQPAGQKSWYLRYRLPTGRRRISLGRFPGLLPDGATQVAKMRLGEVAAGIDVPGEEAAATLAGGQGEDLKAGHVRRRQVWLLVPGQPQIRRSPLERLEVDFGHWWKTPMADLSAAKIDAWRTTERERGVSARTVNRNLSRLRSACAKAVDWGLLPCIPFASIKPLKHDKTLKVRYLTPEQEGRLFAALEAREVKMRAERTSYNLWRAARHLDPLPAYPEPFADYLRPLVIVVRNTGLRRSEALDLQWCNVDLVHKVITITGRRSKSAQTRRVPLNATAVETLLAWHDSRAPETDDEFVFGRDPDGRQLRICTAWRGVRKAAGLSDLRFHDLRHNFASKLVQKGADLNTVRELLGHASIDMTLVYAHLAPDGLAAVERIV